MEVEFGDTCATRSERRQYARVGERACRFTEVRALDPLMEETMTRHGRSLLITRATACTMRTSGEFHDSGSGGTAIKLTIVN